MQGTMHEAPPLSALALKKAFTSLSRPSQRTVLDELDSLIAVRAENARLALSPPNLAGRMHCTRLARYARDKKGEHDEHVGPCALQAHRVAEYEVAVAGCDKGTRKLLRIDSSEEHCVVELKAIKEYSTPVPWETFRNLDIQVEYGNEHKEHKGAVALRNEMGQGLRGSHHGLIETLDALWEDLGMEVNHAAKLVVTMYPKAADWLTGALWGDNRTKSNTRAMLLLMILLGQEGLWSDKCDNLKLPFHYLRARLGKDPEPAPLSCDFAHPQSSCIEATAAPAAEQRHIFGLVAFLSHSHNLQAVRQQLQDAFYVLDMHARFARWPSFAARAQCLDASDSVDRSSAGGATISLLCEVTTLLRRGQESVTTRTKLEMQYKEVYNQGISEISHVSFKAPMHRKVSFDLTKGGALLDTGGSGNGLWSYLLRSDLRLDEMPEPFDRTALGMAKQSPEGMYWLTHIVLGTHPVHGWKRYPPGHSCNLCEEYERATTRSEGGAAKVARSE